jgi:hypothetical protein
MTWRVAEFHKFVMAQIMFDPEWSTSVLFGNGVPPGEVDKIEVFNSSEKNGDEQYYSDLVKSKAVITLDTQDGIAEFLASARDLVSGYLIAAPHNLDLEKPTQTFHIILWKKNSRTLGYGRLLVYRKDGFEYDFLKAADGTGDYRYNSKLLPYIEQLQGEDKAR